MTFAPDSRKRLHIAAPIPLVPPVIITFLSLKSNYLTSMNFETNELKHDL